MMKYIKKFNISINESVEATKKWISDIIINCEDIMVELEDNSFETEVKKSLDSDESILVECIIRVTNGNVLKFRKDIIEVKDRLIDYMKSEGFELTDYKPFVKDGKFKIMFKKYDIDKDYIGHLRYLKRYNESRLDELQDIYSDEINDIKESSQENLPDELYDEVKQILVDTLSTGMLVKTFIIDTLSKDSKILYVMIGRYENIVAREFTIDEDILDDLRRVADVIEMETEFKYYHSFYFLGDHKNWFLHKKNLNIYQEIEPIKGVNMIQLLFFDKNWND